ncbi:MAG TPA: hypothetical protein VII93_00480 [Anaerolineales bacterium]
MNNTKDILFGRWQERKSQAYQQWGRLANVDLTLLYGKTDEVDILFRQYRECSLGQLEAQLINNLHNYDQ